MQLYDRGIRRRLAPMLGGDRRRIELAYSLLFTLPGTPVIRYGDELGMGDDLSQKERNCARTPMQWSDEPHGGFTKHDKPVCPVISEGPYGFEHVNAAIQRRYPEFLLNWTERIIRMRKEVPEIGWGDFAVIPMRNPAILVMRYDWRNNSVLFVHNFDAEPHEIASLPERRASMATFSSTCLALSTARPARMESITWSSRAMGIAGTASAGSTICCGARTSDDANACALSARDACRRSDRVRRPRRGVIVSKTTVALQSPRSAVTIAAWPLAARRYEILARIGGNEGADFALPRWPRRPSRQRLSFTGTSGNMFADRGSSSPSTWRSPISRSCQGATRRLWLRQLGPDLIRASGASNRR